MAKILRPGISRVAEPGKSRHAIDMARLDELAALIGAEPMGPGDREITGVASLAEAGPTDISFFHNPKYLQQLSRTAAGAVLVPTALDPATLPPGPAYLAVANPSYAFAAVVAHFQPPPPPPDFGVHPRAVVEDAAGFDPAAVSIGPGAVISRGVRIGSGTIVGANVYLGPGVTVGENCHFHPGVVVQANCRIGHRVILHPCAVIGGDGFGYEMVDGRHVKIDQVGIVQLDDDVEVGSGTTIDRARFGRTHIGEGTKIDNQVQIAHNVIIGKHCVIVSQTGIAGSTILGDYVTLAAKAGIAGHLRICDRAVVMGDANVTKNLTEPGYYMGFPAIPAHEARRQWAAARLLPDLLDRVRKLEKSATPGA